MLCELASHARIAGSLRDRLPVAATADAAAELERLDVEYLSLEDVFDPRALWEADEPLLAWQGEWSDRVDERAWELVPSLRQFGFRPAGEYFFFLKVLGDTLYRSAFSLAHLVVAARPARVHVFDAARDPAPDTLLLGSGHWGRALSLVADAYDVPVSVLDAPPRSGRPGLRELLPPAVESLARRAKATGPRLRVGPGEAGELIHGAGYDLDMTAVEWRRSGRPSRALSELVSPWAALPDQARLGPALASAWRELRSESLLWEPFAWAGVDLAPLARARMRRWWLSVVPRMWAALRQARAAASRARPAALLLSSAWSPEDHGVQRGLRSMGVPAVTFQHGGFEGNCEYTTYDRTDLRLADHRLVYGQATARYFSERAASSSTRAGEPRAESVAVGSPRLDRLRREAGAKQRAQLRETFGVGGDEQFVVYLPASYARYSWYACRGAYLPVTYLRMLRQVMGVLGEIEGVRVLYKPFPEVPADPMIGAIRSAGSNVSVFEGGGGVTAPDLFNAADVVVMDIPSTALLEVLVEPRRLIVHCDSRFVALREEARPLLARRVVLTETPDGFIAQLHARLGPNGRWDDIDMHDRSFLRAYGTHVDDGRAAVHAAEALKRIADV